MQLNLEDINIMLIANDNSTAPEYKKFFETLGVRYYTVMNANQMENIPQIIPVNGIVVDVASFIKAGHLEKNILNEMEEIYPYIRIKWDENKKQINAMHHDEEIETLEDFLRYKACKFDPRIMRTSQRKEISFNVVVSDTKDFTGVQDRTCTLNASDSGLYVITSSERWREGMRVYLVINELTLRTPIQGTIVRKVPWGDEDLSTPGISVRIDAILDQQQDELLSYIK